MAEDYYGTAFQAGEYTDIRAEQAAKAAENIKALQEQQRKAQLAEQQLKAQKAEAETAAAQMQTQKALRSEAGIAGMQKRVSQVSQAEQYKTQVETAMREVAAQKAEIAKAEAEQTKAQEYWKAAKPVFARYSNYNASPVFMGFAASEGEAEGLLSQYEGPDTPRQQLTSTVAGGKQAGEYLLPAAPSFAPGTQVQYQGRTYEAGQVPVPGVITEKYTFRGGGTPPTYTTESIITKREPIVTQQYKPSWTPYGIGLKIERGIEYVGGQVGGAVERTGIKKLPVFNLMQAPAIGFTFTKPQMKTPTEIVTEAAQTASWIAPYVGTARAGIFVGGVGEKAIMGQKVSAGEAVGTALIVGGTAFGIYSGIKSAKAIEAEAAKTPLQLKGISVDTKGKSFLILKGVKQIGGEPVLVDIKVPMKVTEKGYETLKGGTTMMSYVNKKGELVMKGYKIPAGVKGTVEPEAIWKEISKTKAGTVTKQIAPSAEQKIVIGESQLKPVAVTTMKKTGVLEFGGDVQVMAGKIASSIEAAQKSMTISLFKSVEKVLPSGKIREYVAFKAAELAKVKTISIGTDTGATISKTFTGGKYPVSGVYRSIKITPPSGTADVGGFTVSKIAEGVTIIPKKMSMAEQIVKTEQTQKIIGSAAGAVGVAASKAMAKFVTPSITKTTLTSIQTIAPVLSVIKTKPVISINVPKQTIIQKQIPSQITIPIEKQIPLQKEIIRQKEVSIQRVSPAIKQIPALQSIQKEVSIQRLAQEQIVLQRQTQEQKQITRTAESLLSVTKTPTPLMKIPQGFGKQMKVIDTGEISTGAFKLFIKRFGKYREVPGTFAKGEAIRKGEEIALKTLARSFKIEAAKGYVKRIGIEQYQPQPMKFRTYKVKKGKRIPLKDEWIQKARYSLGTLGERKEIQAARKKKKWF